MILKFKHSVCFFLLCVLFLSNAISGLETEKSLTVSYATNKPLIYPENQRAQGVYAEVLRAVFEDELGIQLKFENRPWKRAQIDVKMGRADIIVTVPTTERLRYVVPSVLPVYQLQRRLYTYPGHPRLDEILTMRSVQDVIDARLKMAAVIGDGWFKEKLLSRGVDANLVPDPRNSFRLLSDRRTDLVITAPSVYKNVMVTEAIEKDIFDTGVNLESISAHILMGKRSPYISLMPEVDHIISEMRRSGQLEAIYKKYN
ncbi:transporter substrate-binding domain-containing protein [Kordiimonas sp. SCSIO 12603]|uniref:substrate-binding periplasmic protein n=1 Tax=Kordiimonas sp. SCSIO 12603 TaxID=2829596 RepID=UPI002106F742|nr:transporter substrate-binding domain-containing protein [Kordiimonas sp. SCSIO 12603]UTW58174.1 transporter substrate-binding domain-containing protein [Kordiimonas sp. SCSIO 12603]